jgi:hypothetical protein
MPSLRQHLHNYRQRQHVRPYALLAPILILLLALPLLRPLRQSNITPDEAATLTAIQSTVEHATLTPLFHVDHPVYVFLLAGPYWLMHHLGLRFSHNPILVSYLLTILGVTLPVAMSAGLIYRMGRLFELRRIWRTSLALACVFATGLFSYSTVLNTQAPASFAILWASACLIHIAIVGDPTRSGLWLALAGLLASAAAVIEPASSPFLFLFPIVILSMRWLWSLRIAGVLVYCLGVLPPLALHLVLASPNPVQSVQSVIHDSHQFLLHPSASVSNEDGMTDDLEDASPRSPAITALSNVSSALLGSHGLLSHFPILLLPFFGIAAVMHRHWPTPTKSLAAITAAASLLILLATAAGFDPRSDSSFASRWFILFTPALLFWTGAWLRRSHRPISYITVATLLAFSTLVSLLGSLNPLPPAGYPTYTPLAALHTLTHHDPPSTLTTLTDPHPEN